MFDKDWGGGGALENDIEISFGDRDSRRGAQNAREPVPGLLVDLLRMFVRAVIGALSAALLPKAPQTPSYIDL
jgi:hypothetical protein